MYNKVFQKRKNFDAEDDLLPRRCIKILRVGNKSGFVYKKKTDTLQVK